MRAALSSSHLSRLLVACVVLLVAGQWPVAAQSSALAAVDPPDVMLERFVDMEQTLRSPTERDALTDDEWRGFDDVLTYHLAGDDLDLQVRSMQIVILHSASVDVRDAVMHVAQIFHESESRHVRRMAAVTLGRMRSDVGIGMLDLLADYEKDPVVQKTAYDVIDHYYSSRQASSSTL